MSTIIPRVTQKVFGSNLPVNNQMVQFGSTLSGSPVTTIDMEVYQALPQFLQGLFVATATGQYSSRVPLAEELNGFFRLSTQQLASIFEDGISTYDSQTNYSQWSIVKNTTSNVLYYSKMGTLVSPNTGNPLTDTTKWGVFYDPNNVVLRDGTTPMNADFDFGGYKGVNLAKPTNPSDAVRLQDLPIANAKLYSVNQGAVSATTGNAQYILRNTATQLIILATAINVKMLSASGILHTITSDQLLNTSSLIDGKYILIYDYVINNFVFVNTGINSITESILPPSLGNNNDYWTTINPLASYKNISGTWTVNEHVKLGEFEILAGAITSGSVINYAFNGRTVIIDSPIGLNTIRTYSDNIGSTLVKLYGYYNNITGANGGAGVTNGTSGYQIGNGIYDSAINNYFLSTLQKTNSLQFTLRTANSGLFHTGVNNGYATGGTPTMIVERSF